MLQIGQRDEVTHLVRHHGFGNVRRDIVFPILKADGVAFPELDDQEVEGLAALMFEVAAIRVDDCSRGIETLRRAIHLGGQIK